MKLIKLLVLSFLIYFFSTLLIENNNIQDRRNLLDINKWSKYIILISLIGLIGSIYSLLKMLLNLINSSNVGPK